MTAQIKVVLVLFLAAFLFLGYNYIGARAVSQYVAEQAALKAEADNTLQTKYDTLSDNYEKLRRQRAEKATVTERIIEKVVDRPVYQNVCADIEGVEAANKALRGD